MKHNKIIALLLIFCLVCIDITPAFAIGDTVKTKKLSKKQAKIQKQKETVIGYVNLPWWQGFDDVYLESYIVRAIENNHDLKIINLKVEQARQNIYIQMANELPTIGMGASPAIVKMPGQTSTQGSFAMPILASYEIDIFLKNHDKTKSARKLYEASKLNEQAAYIAIVSAVGATYFNIVKADKLIEIQQQIVDDKCTIFKLSKKRNEQGLTSTSDLVKAEKSYILAQTNLSDLKKLRATLLTTLAILIGDSPENVNEYKRISYDKLVKEKQVPKMLKSDVITKRPDYLVAEKMIEKAGIDVRVAKKEFLPTFNIGGILGLLTMSGGSMPFNWTSALAAAGINAILPIFTGGRRVASLKIYKSKYEQAIQEYQKTNITAVKEVNDALSDLQYDMEKYNKNVSALGMEQKDFKLSQLQYKHGVISYYDLIQKREAVLATKKLTYSNRMDNYINQISLYKATAANL